VPPPARPDRLYLPREPDSRHLPALVAAVQRNCDISDARHGGDYGLCTFLLKMREYFRWEMELPFGGPIPRQELGDWLDAKERLWDALEEEAFEAIPLEDRAVQAFDTAAANRALLPRGLVYSAGVGRFAKPVFFLGRLARIERREGFEVVVSSCEFARELSAPPAMLLGTTIFVRLESVRRYLWEKLEDWRWRKLDVAARLALAGCDIETDTRGALDRLAEREAETMILHELGEASAGALLGDGWPEMMRARAPTPAEPVARAARDLLADCLRTLPALLERPDDGALHFYFATFDAARRQLFPELVDAYGRLQRDGDRRALGAAVAQGRERWLATMRGWLAVEPVARAAAIAAAGGAPFTPAEAAPPSSARQASP
jgi:hypothetical protein